MARTHYNPKSYTSSTKTENRSSFVIPNHKLQVRSITIFSRCTGFKSHTYLRILISNETIERLLIKWTCYVNIRHRTPWNIKYVTGPVALSDKILKNRDTYINFFIYSYDNIKQLFNVSLFFNHPANYGDILTMAKL